MVNLEGELSIRDFIHSHNNNNIIDAKNSEIIRVVGVRDHDDNSSLLFGAAGDGLIKSSSKKLTSSSPKDDLNGDEKNRVPWNLAGLVSQLPTDSSSSPHYHHPNTTPTPSSGANNQPPYYPHLEPSSHAPPPPGGEHNHPHSHHSHHPHSHHHSHPHPHHPWPPMPEEARESAASSYKVDPECPPPSMYYPQQVPTSSEVPTSEAPPPTATDPLTVFQQQQQNQSQNPNIEHQDVMQTLHQYFSPSDMGTEENSANWMDPNQVVSSGLGEPYSEYGISPRVGNTYGDRKKKIIKEWTKIHTSEAAPDTTSASRSSGIAAPYIPPSGAEFLSPYYSPHIKDEPAFRAAVEYQQYQQYYHDTSLNPYASASNPMIPDSLPGLIHHQPPLQPNPPRRKERKKKNSNAASQQPPQPQQSPGLSGMSRDERKALTLGLPISVADIINLPMDEFNDLLSKHELTEEQLTLCRDIRRRGKNKVAARNCRKRKIDQIKQLEDDVTRIRCRKTELVQEHEKLSSQRSHWTDMVKRLHDYVLKELGHDPLHWELQMDHSRQVHILPRSQNPDHSKIRSYHYAPSLGPPVMEGGISAHIPR
ncbi:Segmentation protein cap'n'collar [Lepeophtheirus salmonis]|uniref:Segmentation protein cap'n'collar n=2 Tax=Lepeophtheirus salmonis TaxID=72036 RepID=A0A7R8GZB0_LEPSM|nr:Segmentation protein cap'n'collar [Lepeophtheirus salmonis]CAF2760774.1 Segmentation protein cap'n'collar [Lepeophtheirus salmonis]